MKQAILPKIIWVAALFFAIGSTPVLAQRGAHAGGGGFHAGGGHFAAGGAHAYAGVSHPAYGYRGGFFIGGTFGPHYHHYHHWR